MLSGRIGKTWLGPSPADPSPGRNPANQINPSFQGPVMATVKPGE